MSAHVHIGNVLDVLPTLDAESVHCCVTSPPYWGLRDYGTATWEGGDADCDHKVGRFTSPVSDKQRSNNGSGDVQAAGVCPNCGARRIDSQLGLEQTPDEYVARMVAVFREVWRVLRDDGTLWLNLGDSYASGPGGPVGATSQAAPKHRDARMRGPIPDSLKPKDLVGIPWRVAFALQQPYEKPHTIAAATDRAWMAALIDGEGCIGIRRYDSHSNGLDHQRCQDSFVPYLSIGNNDRELLDRCVQVTGYGKVGVKDRPDVDSRGIKSRHTYYGWRLDGNAAVDVIRDVYPFLVAKRRQAILCHTLDLSNKNGRALRGNSALPADEQARREEMKRLVNACNQRESVDIPAWAQEPEREIEPGWYLRSDIIWAKPNPMPESVTDRPTKAHEYLFLMTKQARYWYDAEAVAEASWQPDRVRCDRIGGASFNERQQHSEGGEFVGTQTRNRRTVWHIATQPFPEAHFATFPEKLVEPCVLAGCPVGGTVLDPFTGSGTTGAVACRLGRNFVGVELNPEYAAMAERRIAPHRDQMQLVTP